MNEYYPYLLVGLVLAFGIADLRHEVVLLLENEVLRNIEILDSKQFVSKSPTLIPVR